MKRVIDDIAVEVVEAKLVSALRDIFSPIVVFNMHQNLVESIAGESQEEHARRESLKYQLEILGAGLEACKRVTGFSLLGKTRT